MARDVASKAAYRFALVVVGLAACADSVVAPRPLVPVVPTAGMTSYTCTADVSSQTVTCASAGGAAVQSGLAGSRPNLDVVYGGQNLYVTLASANTSYDAADEIFQSDVTVTNKLRDPIGTKDLANVMPQGVRVFFTQQPTVTSGTGTVSVLNPDGVGTFTGGAQPFFQYSQILIQSQTSVPRTWQFDVPSTVNTFVFRVAVSAPIGPRLVITEVMANPTAIADAQGEYFEVYNAGVEPVDMTGWKLRSRSGTTGANVDPIATLPAGIIVPVGGCVLFGINANTATNGGMTLAYQYSSSFALANNNADNVVLRTSADVTMDSVSWNGFTTSGPPAAASRRLKNVNSNNSTMSDTAWATSTTNVSATDTDKGTPCGLPSGANEYPGIGGLANAVGSGGVIIPPGPVTSVTVAPSPASTATGTTLQFSAVARDANTNAVSTTFTWTSSNPGVATIDPATGLATAVATGTTTITATSGNNVAGSSTLTVTEPGAVASISVNPNNTPADIPPGYTRPFFYTARDASGTAISPAPGVTWSSSDPAVATIDQQGYATGVSQGSTVIRATASNGVFGSYTLNVIPATAPTTAVYRNHLEFGTPTDGNPSDDYLLTKPQFALSYSDTRGGPNWVSWNLNATQFGSEDRCNCFSNDQSLPASFYKVTDLDYRNGGYDRGHMVMSYERTTTAQENATTFLLSNILPQSGTSTGSNQGPWLNFENYLNAQAQTSGKEIYIIAGGQYGPTPPTLKNEGHVQVPEYTWKIAVIMNAGQGLANVTSASDLVVYAVRIPNFTSLHASPGDPRYGLGLNTNWTVWKTTVDSIEAATGYNFLDLLNDSIENAVESTVAP